MDDVRWDRIEEVRWRMAHGYYDMPEVLEEMADRLGRAIRSAAGRATSQDDPDLDFDNTVPPT